MKNILVLLVLGLLLLQSCNEKVDSADKKISEIAETSFANKISDLSEGLIDSLTIDFIDSIKAQQLFNEEMEIDYMDMEENVQNGHVYNFLNSYHPLMKDDVLKVTENYILILLKSKSFEIRAATIQPDGSPISSILLFNHFGNNEYKVYRSFSFYEDIPYQYEPESNQFTFSDFRYDVEWIDYPTKGKDVITYEEESVISIDENGQFYLVDQRTKHTAGTVLSL
jgi:hypothetical protein